MSDTRVIILRHARKLPIANPGDALDANGEILAIKACNYLLNTYPWPDAVYACKPSDTHAKSTSIRELQTAGPLLTMLAKRNWAVSFEHPDRSTQYDELASTIKKMHKGDVVFVFWEHHRINDLAQALAINEKLPEWQEDDYTTVYDISLAATPSIIIKRNQYATTFPLDGTFDDIITAVEHPQLALSQKLQDDSSPPTSCASILDINWQFFKKGVRQGAKFFGQYLCNSAQEADENSVTSALNWRG